MKLPYGGTNIIGPDQMPHVMRGIWLRPTIFVTHKHLQRTFLSLHVQCLPQIKYYHKHVETADLG